MTIPNDSYFHPQAGNVWQDKTAKNLSFFCRKPPQVLGDHILDEMVEVSTCLGEIDIRLCLHDGPDARQHDMIIAEYPKNYYRPHKHEHKSDVLHIMRGAIIIVMFDPVGGIVMVREFASGEICRIPENVFHTGIPLSTPVIYHENKPGPFTGPEETIFADWSPEEEDPLNQDSFTRALVQKCRESQLPGN